MTPDAQTALTLISAAAQTRTTPLPVAFCLLDATSQIPVIVYVNGGLATTPIQWADLPAFAPFL